MEISIEDPKEKFKEHLDLVSNNRILFSGKFGTGKSHFLKEYFKVGQETTDYNVFWISPVNYVVGNNQDIFEWIKIDIAKQLLLTNTVTKDHISLSENFLVQTYLYQSAPKLFSTLFSCVAGKLTEKKTGIDFIEKFKAQIDRYNEFKKQAIAENKTDSENLTDVIEKALSAPGSIFEDDITTRIIRANIEMLKIDSQKESIIIIDDLDRLDPEHIFRILNILSCHNDHFDSNKFGFNKVILVCDIHNIEKIYYHKYGEKTDFTGYIEKFCTYEAFHYSLKYAAIDFCKQKAGNGFTEADQYTFSLLLTLLIDENLFTVRNFKKIFNTNFEKKKIELLNIELDGNYNELSYSFLNTKTLPPSAERI